MKRSNNPRVNNHAIKIPDASFKLLMELVAELKEGKGGWLVYRSWWIKAYDRLRKSFEGGLL